MEIRDMENEWENAIIEMITNGPRGAILTEVQNLLTRTYLLRPPT